jgi:sRNA-binding carbon storage regulator CsrA
VLVLTLRHDDAIVVTCPTGERLTISLLKAGSNSVQLGFDGPESIEVDRQTIRDEKDRNGNHRIPTRRTTR